MGWPTAPPDILSNDHVTVRHVTSWTQDKSGAKVRTLGPPSVPVFAMFKPVGGLGASPRLERNLRDTPRSKYIVSFLNVNPKLHIYDELTWVEENKVLVVLATETTGTTDIRLWNALVEERPAV